MARWTEGPTMAAIRRPVGQSPGGGRRRLAQAVAAEVALVRAQLAALEPGPDPLGAGAPAGVRALAGARQRAGGAARGPAAGRRQRPAGARRVADRARSGPDPHRRG